MSVKLRELEPTARLGVGVVFALMAAVFLYGLVLYPDAPLRPCAGGNGYCGKQGAPHSVAEYEAFNRWETCLSLAWPAGAGLMALIVLLRRKRSAS